MEVWPARCVKSLLFEFVFIDYRIYGSTFTGNIRSKSALMSWKMGVPSFERKAFGSVPVGATWLVFALC